MKKLLIGFGVVIVLLLGALFIVPSLVPSDTYRTRIQEQLSTELGRDVRIEGDVRVSTFPVVKARTGRVVVDNAAGFSAENFVSLEALEARIKLLPLLSKRVEISKFTLVRPQISLERLADGSVNWSFGDDTAAPADTAEDGPFRRDGRYTNIDPTISAFNIEDGRLTYVDAVSGASHTLTDINTFLSAPGLAQPLIIEGGLTLDDMPVTLDMRMDSPAAFLNGQSAALSGSFATDGAKADVDGTFPPGEAVAFTGKIDGNITDIELIRNYLPEPTYADLLTQAAVNGEVDLSETTLSMKNGQVSASGPAFTASFDGSADLGGDAPVLDGNLSADVSDIQAFKSLLPEPVKGFEILRTADVKARFASQDTGFTISNANAKVTGDGVTAQYQGGGRYTDALSLNGTFDAKADRPAALAAIFAPDIKGSSLLGPVTAKGAVEFAGTRFGLSDLNVATSSDALKASYAGSVSGEGDALSANGRFDLDTSDLAAIIRETGIDAPADVSLLQAVKANGAVAMTGETLRLTDLTANVSGPTLSGEYAGAVTTTLGTETPVATLDGTFDALIPSLSALNAASETDIAYAETIGRVAAKGRLSGAQDDLMISDLTATLSEGALNGSFAGSAAYKTDSTTLNGAVTADIPSVPTLAKLSGQDIAYADALGRVQAKGKVSGPATGLTLENAVATLSEGELNGEFSGRAVLGTVNQLAGDLNISGQSLRALAARSGTQLPPSTDLGPVFEAFSLKGRVSGTTEAMDLSNATVTLDALTGTGQFGVTTSGTKPMLTGELAMTDLDLRPYMNAYSAQNPTGEIQPWSQTEIPVEGLRAVDGKFRLTTPSVKLTRLSLGQTTVNAVLSNGRLSADIPNLSLYGGSGRATMALDGSGAVPSVMLETTLDQLNSQSFLGAIAGFAKASGTAGTTMKISGSGRSQAEIMQSLSGGGDFKVLEGAIAGIDAGEFMTGLDQALASRALPGGIGPGKRTAFQDLIGKVSIENGVAKIGAFNLTGLGVAADGEGQIDLGGQTIDFRFRPRATGENAKGIAAYGIPLRFSGGFGSATAGLDTDFLGKIVEAKAREEAGQLITREIGGPVGDILGGVIGGGKPATQPTETTAPTGSGAGAASEPTQSTQTQPTPADILGGILGGSPKTQPTEPATEPPAEQAETPAETAAESEEPKTAEEAVEDAVLGIFGLGKEKKKDE